MIIHSECHLIIEAVARWKIKLHSFKVALSFSKRITEETEFIKKQVKKSSKDGHWLKLKNVGPTFSSFNAMLWKLTKKIIIMFSDPWWNGFDIFNP